MFVCFWIGNWNEWELWWKSNSWSLCDFPSFHTYRHSLTQNDQPGCFVVQKIHKNYHALNQLKPQCLHADSLCAVHIPPEANVTFKSKYLKNSMQTADEQGHPKEHFVSFYDHTFYFVQVNAFKTPFFLLSFLLLHEVLLKVKPISFVILEIQSQI